MTESRWGPYQASARLAEVRHSLHTLDLDERNWLRPVLVGMCDALQARNAVAYLPEPTEQFWDLPISEWVGADWESRRDAHRAFVCSVPSNTSDFAAYDPFYVESAQRNRALTNADLAQLEPNHAQTHRRLYRALNASGEHQARILVCSGPRLLLWVGVVSPEPFSSEAVGALQSLAEPLRVRMESELSMRPSASGPWLDALLEHMAEPALLVRRNGRVEHVNLAAEKLLASPAGREEVVALRAALKHGAAPQNYRVHALASRGLPEHYLVLRERPARNTAVAVARASRAWELTPKLCSVLEKLCAGLSNKEIAAELGCAEVTVERYLTRLFRVSGTHSRTELVAALYRMASG